MSSFARAASKYSSPLRLGSTCAANGASPAMKEVELASCSKAPIATELPRHTECPTCSAKGTAQGCALDVTVLSTEALEREQGVPVSRKRTLSDLGSRAGLRT